MNKYNRGNSTIIVMIILCVATILSLAITLSVYYTSRTRLNKSAYDYKLSSLEDYAYEIVNNVYDTYVSNPDDIKVESIDPKDGYKIDAISYEDKVLSLKISYDSKRTNLPTLELHFEFDNSKYTLTYRKVD